MTDPAPLGILRGLLVLALPLVVLVAGRRRVILFLLAHAAFQWGLTAVARAVVWPRLTAAALLLALLPLTARVSALWALIWLAVVCLVAAVTEFLVSRPQRRRLRASLAAEPGDTGCGLAPS